MAWYDQLADDPQKVLDDVAEWRGYSREELNARRDRIHQAAGIGGPHLTLNQIDGFGNGDPGLPPAAVAHYETCEYCKSLVDALVPTAVEENKDKAVNMLTALGLFSDDDQPAHLMPAHTPALATTGRSGWFARVAVVASVAIASVIGTIWFQGQNTPSGESPLVATNNEDIEVKFWEALRELDPEQRDELKAALATYPDTDIFQELAMRMQSANGWQVVDATVDDSGNRIVELRELPPMVLPVADQGASRTAFEKRQLEIGNVVTLSEPVEELEAE